MLMALVEVTYTRLKFVLRSYNSGLVYRYAKMVENCPIRLCHACE